MDYLLSLAGSDAGERDADCAARWLSPGDDFAGRRRGKRAEATARWHRVDDTDKSNLGSETTALISNY